MGESTYIKPTIIKCAACGRPNIFNRPYPYHAGFGDQGFLYNDAGNCTLVWSVFDPAFEAVVGKLIPWVLDLEGQKKLEDALLPSPFGDSWRFSNPARCLNFHAVISSPMMSCIYYLQYDNSVIATKPHEPDYFQLGRYLKMGR